MDFEITDERSRQIAAAARVLWFEFLDLNPQFTSLSLLTARDGSPLSSVHPLAAKPSSLRNECAEAFFRHCAETMLQRSGLVINEIKLKRWMTSVKGQPVSWLLHVPAGLMLYKDGRKGLIVETEDIALALLDYEYLWRAIPRRAELVWTGLLLHETGHLVLHWDDMEKRRGNRPKVMARKKEEAEAWLFQSVVTGLALGAYAMDCCTEPRGKAHDRHEDAWRFA